MSWIESTFAVALAAASAIVAARVLWTLGSLVRIPRERRHLTMNDFAWSLIPLALLLMLSCLVFDRHA